MEIICLLSLFDTNSTHRQKYSATRIFDKKIPPSDGGHACDGGLAEETLVLLELAVPLIRSYVRLRRSQVTVPATDDVPMYKISLHPNHDDLSMPVCYIPSHFLPVLVSIFKVAALKSIYLSF